MVVSGLAAFLIYVVTSSTSNLILSAVFGAVSTMGFNALDCLGAELFPTAVRSTAMSITLAAARLGAILGNIIFGFMLDVACAVPILLVAALLIGTVQPATRFANSVDDFVFFFFGSRRRPAGSAAAQHVQRAVDLNDVALSCPQYTPVIYPVLRSYLAFILPAPGVVP